MSNVTGKARLFLICIFLAQNLLALEADQIVRPTRDKTENKGPINPDRVLPHEHPIYKNYFVPFFEIPLFQLTLNQADRHIYPDGTYATTFESGWDHVIHGPWVVDQDDFTINQMGHPYQGTIYYGAARSSGMNFFESWAYANAGSYVWETYGERTNPSINDQVASGSAGSLFGEPLYRLCNYIMEGGGERPSFLRLAAATLVSPPTMLNRFLFGPKYGPTLASRDPAIFIRLDAGAGRIALLKEPRTAMRTGRGTGFMKVSLDYGLPGKPGYRYFRPFDYFHVEVGGDMNAGRTYEKLLVRGLIVGTSYEGGESLHGIWGLYGHFDYLAPQIYRFSTTAVSLGTTGQWDVSRYVALQGTALAGVGYASAGTIRPDNDQNDFHYGTTPQGFLSLRMLLGTRLVLDTSARVFHITDRNASRAPGFETINQLDSSILFRIRGGHAVSVAYEFAERDAHYNQLPSLSQRTGTLRLMYTYISNRNLGRVYVK